MKPSLRYLHSPHFVIGTRVLTIRIKGPALLRQVESELASAKAKIAAVTKKLEQLKEQSGGGTRVLRKKPTGLLNGLNATKRALGPSLTANLNGKAKDDGEKDTLYPHLDSSWLTSAERRLQDGAHTCDLLCEDAHKYAKDIWISFSSPNRRLFASSNVGIFHAHVRSRRGCRSGASGPDTQPRKRSATEYPCPI